MATGSRTLTLKLLADIDNFNKSINSANNDVETFGDKVGKVGKVVGAAFVAAAAAAGAYAVKIGVEGVKAAIEDEAAQNRLALALKNATGATDAQIKATEDYILKTELATGKTDTELRSALGRLAMSTQDTTKAQELLNLALDISAQTGKPLEAVSNALGKAYDGQTTALGRLGVGLGSAELKGKSFADIQKILDDRFAGASAAAAETYEGRIARVSRAFDEAKEGIGAALLPILSKLLTIITDNLIPAFSKIEDALTGGNGIGGAFEWLANVYTKVLAPVWNSLLGAFDKIGDAIKDNKDTFMALGKIIAEYVAPAFGTVLGGAIKIIGTVIAGVINLIGDVADVVVKVVNGAISAVNTLIKAYNAIPLLPNIPTIGNISAPAINVPNVSATSIAVPSVPTIAAPNATSTTTKSTSTTATPNISYTNGTNLFDYQYKSNPFGTSGVNTTNLAGIMAASGPTVTVAPTINIGVAGDPQGVANTIVDVLTQSTARGAISARLLE